ncbi:MAG: ATP-dependent metallopeptidase FtsH/Yme1/Tma family protein, partial [Eubacteriales bacterium]|nr:ATP-dependent metallopeptidase FtsH/Yme1/Tma family protein [Eubacteriales bacterium]
QDKTEQIPYNSFLEKLENKKIDKVFLTEGEKIRFIEINEDKIFITDNPRTFNFKENLLKNGVSVKEATSFNTGISSILGILLIGGILFIVYKNFNKKEKTTIVVENFQENEEGAVYFKDIAGNEEAKENAKDIIDFLKEPEKYEKIGARIPKGIMFYGEPGTGKTLMAKAIASEAKVPFYSVCGSDFVEMYVGVGAARVRNLFKNARQHKKAVIFIDEIDAIGKKRSSNINNANDEKDQTLNALLSEMSGFSKDSGIIVIATTNRLELLDDALLRAGRFDRHIEISLPDRIAREKIIELYLKNKNIDETINIKQIAKKTVYFSGAMLENLINEASIFAIKDNKDTINISHIDKAYLKIIAGDEKKERGAIREEDRKITAFHEAGHATLTKLLEPTTSISKISIIPTTKGAGGFCLNIFKDKLFHSKKDLENQIMIAYGGRIAEELIFGLENITTGAYNDIEKATNIIKYNIKKKISL